MCYKIKRIKQGNLKHTLWNSGWFLFVKAVCSHGYEIFFCCETGYTNGSCRIARNGFQDLAFKEWPEKIRKYVLNVLAAPWEVPPAPIIAELKKAKKHLAAWEKKYKDSSKKFKFYQKQVASLEKRAPQSIIEHQLKHVPRIDLK